MTAKEKAQELVDKYKSLRMAVFYQDEGIPAVMESDCTNHTAKQCAMIAVDEIIKTWENNDGLHFMAIADCWRKIREEIEKL